jgi:type II secretory pathway component GspD/PulD (secretin)
MPVRLVLAAILTCACAAVMAQGTVLEVIPLRHRTVEQVLPVVQPMVAPGGTLSGFQGQLVVRTTPANLDEIKRILGAIDTPARRLLITVMEDAEASRTERAAEIAANIGGERGRVVVPGSADRSGANVVLRDGDDRLRGRVVDSSSSAAGRNAQSVQVLEGGVAYISTGQSVPVREQQVTRSVVGGQVVERVVTGTQYRDTATGFYALPRLAGDRVTLEISAQREALSGQLRGAIHPERSAIDTQRTSTTVSGRLGEWMEIGGVATSASGQQSVLLGRAATATSDTRRVIVKVEELR